MVETTVTTKVLEALQRAGKRKTPYEWRRCRLFVSYQLNHQGVKVICWCVVGEQPLTVRYDVSWEQLMNSKGDALDAGYTHVIAQMKRKVTCSISTPTSECTTPAQPKSP